MPEKTAAEKMRLKAGLTAAILHAPGGVVEGLGIPAGVAVVDDPIGADFVLEFATGQAEVEARLAALKPHLTAATLLWLAYPKGAKAAGRDVSRDTIWAFAQSIGLRLVANVAIDDTWSALRVRPAG